MDPWEVRVSEFLRQQNADLKKQVAALKKANEELAATLLDCKRGEQKKNSEF